MTRDAPHHKQTITRDSRHDDAAALQSLKGEFNHATRPSHPDHAKQLAAMTKKPMRYRPGDKD